MFSDFGSEKSKLSFGKLGPFFQYNPRFGAARKSLVVKANWLPFNRVRWTIWSESFVTELIPITYYNESAHYRCFLQ